MGMFDEVVCRYRLPHHQDATFQTKDLAAVALGERCLDGLLDEYLITEDGRLRRHVHEREWVEDAGAPFRGYLKSVRDWWEDLPEAHGDVVIYTSETAVDLPDEAVAGAAADSMPDHLVTTDGPIRFIEFRIRFTNGRVQHVLDLSEPRPPGDQAGDAAPHEPDDAEAGPRIPPRSAEEQLLTSIRESLASLEALLERATDHWGREDAV
jgi:hypothetical protein